MVEEPAESSVIPGPFPSLADMWMSGLVVAQRESIGQECTGI